MFWTHKKPENWQKATTWASTTWTSQKWIFLMTSRTLTRFTQRGERTWWASSKKDTWWKTRKKESTFMARKWETTSNMESWRWAQWKITRKELLRDTNSRFPRKSLIEQTFVMFREQTLSLSFLLSERMRTWNRWSKMPFRKNPTHLSSLMMNLCILYG